MFRVGVISFPGSLDDVDAVRAIRLAGADPKLLWHTRQDLDDVDAVVLPGGFSYGDYLRCGALASRSPVMRSVSELAARGLPVLGICNGFQILTETKLLPGALVRNQSAVFICRPQRLRVENVKTAFTGQFSPHQQIVIPIKSADGGFVASPEEIKRLEGEGQVVLRYLDNPNGSLNDIAGVCNKQGNVVGLMPHPEHACEAGFGPDSTAGFRSGLDGLPVFESLLRWLKNYLKV